LSDGRRASLTDRRHGGGRVPHRVEPRRQVPVHPSRRRVPAKVWKLDIATGRRELFREIVPADVAGVTSIEVIFLTPDARTLIYGYTHNLSDLYVVSNLK
jgi:hypothetical protein